MGFANRGAFAEKKVKECLEDWEAGDTCREFSRLTDTKAAGRIIKAADADFAYYANLDRPEDNICHGLIEVKETEHEYRLSRDKVSQLPRLRKREKCGGTSVVLVYHSTLKVWRALSVGYLANFGDKGSWNLTEHPTFPTAALALRHFNAGVFP